MKPRDPAPEPEPEPEPPSSSSSKKFAPPPLPPPSSSSSSSKKKRGAKNKNVNPPHPPPTKRELRRTSSEAEAETRLGELRISEGGGTTERKHATQTHHKRRRGGRGDDSRGDASIDDETPSRESATSRQGGRADDAEDRRRRSDGTQQTQSENERIGGRLDPHKRASRRHDEYGGRRRDRRGGRGRGHGRGHGRGGEGPSSSSHVAPHGFGALETTPPSFDLSIRGERPDVLLSNLRFDSDAGWMSTARGETPEETTATARDDGGSKQKATSNGTADGGASDAPPDLLPSTAELLKMICPSFDASSGRIGDSATTAALEYSTERLQKLRPVEELYDKCVRALNDVDKMRSSSSSSPSSPKEEEDDGGGGGDDEDRAAPNEQREERKGLKVESSNGEKKDDGPEGGNKEEEKAESEKGAAEEAKKAKTAAAAGKKNNAKKQKRSYDRRQMRIRRLESLQRARMERLGRVGPGGGGGGKGNQVDSPPESSSEEAAATSPASRLCAASNSLVVLVRALLPALNHPRRLDGELKMSPPPSDDEKKKNGNRRRAPCYLLFPEVYGVTTAKGLSALELQLSRAASAVDPAMFDAAENWRRTVNREGCSDKEQAREDPLRSVLRRSLLRGTATARETAFASLGPFLWRGGTGRSKQEAAESSRLADKVDEVLISTLFKRHPDWVRECHRSAVEKLVEALRGALGARRRPEVRIDVYGSCLSDLALGRASDVDVSLSLPWAANIQRSFDLGNMSADEYDRKITRCVFDVASNLRRHFSFGGASKSGGRQERAAFADIVPVTNARVPVVKGTFLNGQNPFSQDGSLSFDICFLNDIAVANSRLLAEYSKLDDRVRSLMLSVKSWAKANGVGSAADGTLSSYSWMNLCVFYLQCVGFVPNLQCPRFMAEHGLRPEEERAENVIDGLNTAFVDSAAVKRVKKWSRPKYLERLSATSMVCGFFVFYADVFPHYAAAVSIRRGKCALLKTVFESARFWRLCVEDPFETHDSHRPHDLGVHLEERGHVRVMGCLRRAVDVTNSVFVSSSSGDDGTSDGGKKAEERDLGASAIYELLVVGDVERAGPPAKGQQKHPKRQGQEGSTAKFDGLVLGPNHDATKSMYYDHSNRGPHTERRLEDGGFRGRHQKGRPTEQKAKPMMTSDEKSPARNPSAKDDSHRSVVDSGHVDKTKASTAKSSVARSHGGKGGGTARGRRREKRNGQRAEQ